jgi:NADH-quinone oxidoreductase subunit J
VSFELIIFFVLGALAIASGITTIRHKNPVVSAISLIFHFFMLAGLYLSLNAQFLAVLQILVYAGAIMVLVIFVIMLLNLGDEEKLKEKFNMRKLIGTGFGVILALQFVIIYMTTTTSGSSVASSSVGSPEVIGLDLFNNYLFPFEAISLLLLAAIIGSVILAKRKVD